MSHLIRRSSKPRTVGELVRLLNPPEDQWTGIIKQIDADTIRIQRGNSPKFLRNVPLVGASVTDVSVGDKIELRIIEGSPYAYRLKSLQDNL